MNLAIALSLSQGALFVVAYVTETSKDFGFGYCSQTSNQFTPIFYSTTIDEQNLRKFNYGNIAFNIYFQ
ncbi:MAG: hypothetical protein QM751_11050 [Paludibacteraceae bacterium]